MLNVTTKTIKVLDTTGIKRGMILSLENTMSCDKFNVVVKNVYDNTSAFGKNMIKAVVISGKSIGEEISITADHTYVVKKMEVVEAVKKPLFKIAPSDVDKDDFIKELEKKISENKWDLFFNK